MSMTSARSVLGVRRPGQRFFRRPAVPQPLIDGDSFNARTLGPLGHVLRNAVAGYKAIVSPVISLLFGDGPPTILRGVRAVIVRESVDCMDRTRAFPHVGQKVGEAVGAEPPLANFDPTATVSCVTASDRIGAPENHLIPTLEGRGSGHPMSGIAFASSVGAEAPARTDLASAEIAGEHLFFFAAIAPAQPIDATPPFRSQRDHGQTSKPRSDQRLHGCHKLIIPHNMTLGNVRSMLNVIV